MSLEELTALINAKAEEIRTKKAAKADVKADVAVRFFFS